MVHCRQEGSHMYPITISIKVIAIQKFCVLRENSNEHFVAKTHEGRSLALNFVHLMRFIHCIVIPVHYRPQRSCGQGNNFTPVCHSVHRRRGVSEADPPEADPLGSDTPREQTPPLGADTPQEQTPPLGADTPPEQTPGADTP